MACRFFYSVMRLMISISNFAQCVLLLLLIPKGCSDRNCEHYSNSKWTTNRSTVLCLAAFLHDVIGKQLESRQTKLHVCYWLILCYHLSQFQLLVVATSFPITLAMSTVVHSKAIEENSEAGRMLCAHVAQLKSSDGTSVQSKQFKHARYHHWYSVGFCASRDAQLTLAHNAIHPFTHLFSLLYTTLKLIINYY